MSQSIHESAESSSWFHYLAWLPIPIFLIIIFIFAWFRPGIVWNPPLLFAALNIIFLTFIMLFVSILAIRSYLAKKSVIILLLGSGTLALGLGGLIAGIAILGNSPNSIVSIYNTSAFISSFFILVSAILSITMRTKILRSVWLIFAFYLAVIALICIVAFLVGNHLWPAYFIQGSGPTTIDLAVLYATITLFTVSALLLLIHSVKEELNFRIWYGLGLGLIAVGLFGVSLQTNIGDPLNWLGRISQYLGAVYILIAIILSIHETGVWLLPWQQSLYEMEEKYHSLYNSMNEGVAIHRILYKEGKAVDYTIMDVNPSYEEILGLKREDVVGRKASEIYGTGNPPYLDIYSSVTESGNPKTFETYFEPMDIYFNISVFSPKQEEFATIFEDITVRKEAEKNLRISEARFRSVLKNSSDVIYRFNLQTGRYEYMSPAIRSLGFEPEMLMAMSNDEVISRVHPNDRPDLLSVLSHINQSGKGVAEYRFRGNDDIYRWWSNQMVIIKDSQGKPLYRDGSVRDITKRKQIEDALHKSEKNLAEAQRIAHIGSWEWNIQNGEILWSDELYSIYGLDMNTFTPTLSSFADYVHPDDLEYVNSIIDQITSKGTPVDFDFRIVRTDGSTRILNTMAEITEFDEKRTPLIMSGINQDITERKQAEEQVKIRSEELAKSNADLKQFAYVASHDLREPLRMISTFLQLLERRYADQLDEDANEFIGFAVDGAKRLDKMITDLLEYSRVANVEMHFTEVDIREVVEQVSNNLKVLIEENNAQINYDSLPKIKSDENLMIILFQNLISNAIKYRREETPKIHISAVQEGDIFVFCVKDNGIGIDPKHLERIFTIFKRLHTHEEYEGSGIGLSIAQRIVHQHGGEIWAESQPGKGSTFNFTIPAKNT